jgi:hypothetical protein
VVGDYAKNLQARDLALFRSRPILTSDWRYHGVPWPAPRIPLIENSVLCAGAGLAAALAQALLPVGGRFLKFPGALPFIYQSLHSPDLLKPLLGTVLERRPAATEIHYQWHAGRLFD